MKDVIETALLKSVPPAERLDRERFRPLPNQDLDGLKRRRDAWIAAAGGTEQHMAQLAASNVEVSEWERSLKDVERIDSAKPVAWEIAARRLCSALFEAEAAGYPPDKTLTLIYDMARSDLMSLPLENITVTTTALGGLLNYLEFRIGGAFHQSLRFEISLGTAGRTTWRDRLTRSPVLAFLFGTIYVDWFKASKEILERADADFAQIRRRFLSNDGAAVLRSIEAGLGDPHAGGRSVAILSFAGGKVVYKPKDLRIVDVVQSFASILSAETGLSLYVPDQVAMSGYTWQRFVETRTLSGAKDAVNFWANLGGWLGLIQTLGGNDFWFDNLLAAGAIPVFIDFETALQPALVRFPAATASTTRRPGVYEMSMLGPFGTGILPWLFPIREGEDPTDLGCTSAPGKHRSPLPLPSNHQSGDTFEWEEDKFAPRYANGQYADAGDHVLDFLGGYRAVLGAIGNEEVRGKLHDQLAKLDNAPVRVICIDTWSGYRMIQNSLRPRDLSNGVWREIQLQRALAQQDGLDGEVRSSAFRDLRRLDIPLFQCAANDNTLGGSEGETGFYHFPMSPQDHAHARLDLVAAQPIEAQVSFARSCFVARLADRSTQVADNAHVPSIHKVRSLPSTDLLLAHCATLCQRIRTLALADDLGAPNWLGFVRNPFTGIAGIAPLGVDLAQGRTGVALGLALAGNATGDRSALDLAAEAISGAAQLMFDNPSLLRQVGIGAGSGAGGVIYALLRIAALSRRAELEEQATRIVNDLLASGAWSEHGKDYLSGAAGLVCALEASGASGAPVRQLLEATRRSLSHGIESKRRYAPSAQYDIARLPSEAGGLFLCGEASATELQPTIGDRLACGDSIADGLDGVTAIDRLWLALGGGAEMEHVLAAAGDFLEQVDKARSWLPGSRIADDHNLSVVSGLSSVAAGLAQAISPTADCEIPACLVAPEVARSAECNVVNGART